MNLNSPTWIYSTRVAFRETTLNSNAKNQKMDILDTARKQNMDICIEDVVSRAQSGQLDAFSILYEEYLGRVYRYVFARLSSVELAEDITQEVFLRAFEDISSFRFRGKPFIAWLFRIAHNLIIDHHRRSNRFRLIPVPEPVTNSGEDPFIVVESNLEMAKLRQAITKLPPAQKEAVTFRLLVGLSINETARAMGKSEGAVKSLQHDGTRNLRKLMERG